MNRVIITTYPFSHTHLLGNYNVDTNPYGRRLKADEVHDVIKNYDMVIAGTEPYTPEVLKGTKVKQIHRVGVGLDNIPQEYCKENGIIFTNTPDAPTQAVAELTISNIINLLRGVHHSDRSVRSGGWTRYMGSEISEVTIGIIGLGRIGSRLIKLLDPFYPTIIGNDIVDKRHLGTTLTSKEEILKRSDVITLHIPGDNVDYISDKEFELIKPGAILINTSRGGGGK